jgi:hypothetical protein
MTEPRAEAIAEELATRHPDVADRIKIGSWNGTPTWAIQTPGGFHAGMVTNDEMAAADVADYLAAKVPRPAKSPR